MARPTIKDVARVAGVSIKTVSRVVNGEPTVAPDLAARVRDAVDSLGYRPHVGASSLRRGDGRTGTVALLLEDVGSPFSAALHRAVEDAARARGVQVLTGSLDDDPDRERELARVIAARRPDGLIMAPVSADVSHLAADLRDIPVVFVDSPAHGIAADTVLATNRAGALDAVRHLLALGHRRIAYLGDRAGIGTARHRHEGYLAALREAGVTAQPDLVVHDLRTAGAAEAAVAAMLIRADPPTALFTGRDLITVGAVRALRGLLLQDEVALVGFGDFPLADLLEPAVTVVAQDPAAMGRTAAQALFHRIDGAGGPPREHWIPTTLIRRGSSALVPADTERPGVLTRPQGQAVR